MRTRSCKPVFLFILNILFFLIIIQSCKKASYIAGESHIVLSSNLPAHHIDYTQSKEDIQTQFDKEMWQTFIALSSPADGLNPSPKGNILDQEDAKSVFENYSFNYDLFLLNMVSDTNFKPVGWGQPDALDQQRRKRWNSSSYCPDLVAQAETKGITNMASLLALDEFIQASNGARPHVPIVDQNQNYVRTGVVYNKATYDWVIANQLETYTGVKIAETQLTKQEVTQIINDKDTTFYQMANVLETPIGSIQLKTSWKILGSGDDPSKFHKAWAVSLFENTNFADGTTVIPQCELIQVGLVGMHIVKKTETQKDYIWATFEHIDNCPEKGNIEDKHYSFYDYKAQGSEKENQPPIANSTVNNDSISFTDPKWFNPQGSPNKPSQIVREIPISEGTQTVNQSYREALTGTVWANYQLVGTQWLNREGKVYPELLSNTTLETFEQNVASCYGCHHQLKPNTFKGTINNEQYTMGNVLNLKLDLLNTAKDTAVYSDYMWSLLKWSKNGQLTWDQIKK